MGLCRHRIPLSYGMPGNCFFGAICGTRPDYYARMESQQLPPRYADSAGMPLLGLHPSLPGFGSHPAHIDRVDLSGRSFVQQPCCGDSEAQQVAGSVAIHGRQFCLFGLKLGVL